ncbi:MAG TPA: hypothetical protein PKC69_09085 [Chitinophagaceae bacterium]|nr:hypothetical protein [Chitinophagaceae bacterium]
MQVEITPGMSMEIKSLVRRYTGNSEWILKTDKGQASLKNIYSDGSEWQLSFSGADKYIFKQAYQGDWSEWKIICGARVMYFTVSFKNDYNEWRTGSLNEFVYAKTVYNNNYSEWRAEGKKGKMTVKNIFSDGSEWLITDNMPDEDPLSKLSSVFACWVTAVWIKR